MKQGHTYTLFYGEEYSIEMLVNVITVNLEIEHFQLLYQVFFYNLIIQNYF